MSWEKTGWGGGGGAGRRGERHMAVVRLLSSGQTRDKATSSFIPLWKKTKQNKTLGLDPLR